MFYECHSITFSAEPSLLKKKEYYASLALLDLLVIKK